MPNSERTIERRPSSHARIFFPAVLVVATLLSACGGGGGGGGSGASSGPPPSTAPPDPGDDPPAVTYSGSSSAATFTESPDNSGRMADRIVDSVVFAESLGYTLTSVVGAIRSCVVAPIFGELAADGSGWRSGTLQNCDAGNGLKWNGKAIFRSKAPNGGNRETSLTFAALTVVRYGHTWTIAGSVQNVDAGATYTVTANFAVRDAAGNSFRAENVVIELTQSSSPLLAKVSGRVYESGIGYSELSTANSIELVTTSAYVRGGGAIRARGTGSSIWISPVTPRLTALELDTSGLPTASKSVLLQSDDAFEAQLSNPHPGSFGAAAGPEQTLIPGKQYRLNGRFTGADSHAWADFSWQLMMVPPGSAAQLVDAHSPTPALTPDLQGVYSVMLTSSSGNTVTTDAVSLRVPYPEDTFVPPASAFSIGPYLGPDIAAPASHSISGTTAFSTYAPTGNPVVYDYALADSRGATIEHAQIGPDQSLPTTGFSYTGFQEQRLFKTGEEQVARRFVAHQLPLAFHRPVGFRGLGAGFGLAVGDVSGHGRQDIVATGYLLVPGGNVKTVGVYRSNSPGRYADPQYVSAGNGGAVVLGDFNGDGRPDIAVESFSAIDLIFQQSDGGWSAPQHLEPARGRCGNDIGNPAHPFVTADFNADGYADLALICPYSPSSIVVFMENGDGTFTERDIPMTEEPRVLLAADVTNDGLADLIGVFVSPFTNAPAHADVYPSTGASFGAAVVYPIPEPPTGGTVAGATGDYDGDGRPDLVVATLKGYYWFRQSGGSGFTGGGKLAPFDKPLWATDVDIAAEFQVGEMVLHDVDDDGRVDVIVRSSITNSILFLLHQPNGALAPANSVFARGSNRDQLTLPAFLDENGDGRTDMAYRGGVNPEPGQGQVGVAFVFGRKP